MAKSPGFGSDMLAVIAAGTPPVPVGAFYDAFQVRLLAYPSSDIPEEPAQ